MNVYEEVGRLHMALNEALARESELKLILARLSTGELPLAELKVEGYTPVNGAVPVGADDDSN